MTPFFNLEKLRKVPGCENAMIVDPYAGGKGNSIRYMDVSPRDNYMRAQGMSNLFVGGEKSGFYVGHTEAICTGSLAGHNAARFCAGVDFLQLPESIAIGDMLKYSNIEMHKQDGDKLSRFYPRVRPVLHSDQGRSEQFHHDRGAAHLQLRIRFQEGSGHGGRTVADRACGPRGDQFHPDARYARQHQVSKGRELT